ncbi:MAG: TatD family hydrolase [Chloroflexota bacterium]|nr:TatD family hydrolase [Chloroflexota bacterium]
MYRLIDTHAHLEEITDLDQAIAAAKSAGVIAVIAVGSDYESNRQVLYLGQTHPGFIYPALGLHPWNLKSAELDRNLEFIENNITKAIGVGEIGLDYDKRVRAVADKDLQKRALSAVLRIAKQHGKPALIHSRYAWQDALDAVVAVQMEKVVFHWYTGTSSVLRGIIAQGYYISATPAVEYHEEHKRAIKEAPLDRLLLETDSPVRYQRGTEFEFAARPADVARSLKGAAKLKEMSETQVAEATTQNALMFFNLSV